MKQGLVVALALMVLLPSAAHANVLTRDGDVAAGLQHVGGTDWNTGKGRHDAVVRWASDDNYILKSTGMIGRGISNVSSGWAELFIQPINWSKNSPLVVGQVAGIFMGVTMATLRTVSGAIDLATFWVPWWHGVPMGKPVLGLNDVHEYEVIEDAEGYDESTKRYFFG